MRHYENILVCVGLHLEEGAQASHPGASLTGDCRTAVERAIEIATHNAARLTFCHVFAVAPEVGEGLLAPEHEEESVVVHVRELMRGLVDRAQSAGIVADYKLLVGKPWSEVAALVDHDKHDLVIVGSRQRSGIKRALFGSTATRIMLDTSCPVLVVQGRGDSDFHRVVIASDLTELGIEVLRHGMVNARSLGCPVSVVHGVENWYEHQWDRAGFARGAIEREHAREKDDARELLGARVRELVRELGVEAPEVRVETGTPESVICEIATSDDLLVMGFTGRKGLSGMWVGDTAKRVLPALPCSLLAVKPGMRPAG